MNKTISINIAGTVFYIEEDGYEKLKNYLNSIQKYFANYEDSAEIVTDIEWRMAERFSKKQKADNKQVLALADVDELVAAMGTVADFEAVEADEEPKTIQQPTPTPTPRNGFNINNQPLVRDTKRKLLGGVCAGIAHIFKLDPLLVRLVFLVLTIGILPLANEVLGDDSMNFFGPLSGILMLLYVAIWVSFPASNTLEDNEKIKKFYRNSDTKVIGGVAGGVASYFGVDIGVVRLLFVISIFAAGTGLILYLILWAIAPTAKTLTEKMEMTGQPITLENIETNVRQALQPNETTENVFTKTLLFPFRLLAMVFKGISPILGFGASALRIFAGVILTLVGNLSLLGLVVALGLALGIGSWEHSFINIATAPFHFISQEVSPLAFIFVFLVAAVPMAAIGWAGVSLLTRQNKFTPTVWQTLLGLFLVGVIGSSIMGTKYSQEFISQNKVENEQIFKTKTQLLLDVNDIDNDLTNEVSFDFEGYTSTDIKVVTTQFSQGRGRANALENAKKSLYNIVQKDSVLVFDSNLSLADNSKFRGQHLSLLVYVPYNKEFSMTRDFYQTFNIWDEPKYEYNFDDTDNNDFKKIRWVYKSDSGLVCLNRKIVVQQKEYSTTQNDDSDANYALDDDFTNAFMTDNYGDNSQSFVFADFKNLNIKGAYNVQVSEGEAYTIKAYGEPSEIAKMEIELDNNTLKIGKKQPINNLSEIKVLVKITMPKLENINVAGTNNVKINNFDDAKNIDLDVAGASNVLFDGSTQKLDVSISGASKVVLSGATKALKADLVGASTLEASTLTADEGDIKATGASHANVGKINNLQSKADFASSINVKH